MGDSDEEYDQRRRDKFRSERSDYSGRGPPGPPMDDRRRPDWQDRRPPMPPSSGGGGGYGGGGGGGYQRPPSGFYQRQGDGRDRRDPPPGYGGHRSGGGGGGGGGDYRDNRSRDYSPDRRGYDQPQSKRPRREDGDGGGGSGGGDVGYPTQPMMMTFKNFLSQQDDSIDDEEAVKKYATYKLQFKKEQLTKFFAEHKDEEWFKSRYHPDEFGLREKEVGDGIRNRKSVWEYLLTTKFMNDLAVDLDKTGEIVRFLDAAVIKLEGGSDFDLTILDTSEEPPPDLADLGKTKATPTVSSTNIVSPSASGTAAGAETGAAGDAEAKAPLSPAKKEEEAVEAKNETAVDEEEEEGETGKKRKRRGEDGEDEESGSEDEEKEKAVKEEKITTDEEEEKKPKEEKMEEGEKDEETKADETEESRDLPAPAAPVVPASSEEAVKPRPLHRTCSIFLRNLAPNITKQEVDEMCKKFPGYLRLAIADPQPERRFYRRGWASFERNVNIKEICWNINNLRLRDCDLGAIVNRDLSRRIRPINGISQHKQVVKNDIRLAAKIVQNYDRRHKLHQNEEGDKGKNGSLNGAGFPFASKNPLLRNITDYLVDEADAEEEELLGLDATKPKSPADEIPMDRDEKLIAVLDRLVLYLRLVHSFDYYNAIEYPSEDEMPNRCGIIHSRGPDPATLIPPVKITQNDLTEWISAFEKKIAPFLEFKDKLDPDEAKKLGFKDEEEEVEKFIQANTHELAKDKWLCPLSGKKFKGPDFVRKHILNKHVEKIDEVKKEVAFFNNYLVDPKRPQLPEHPGNKPRQGSSSGSTPMHPPPSDNYGHHRSYPNEGYGGSRGGNNYSDRGNSGYGGGYPKDRREPAMPPAYGSSMYRGGPGGGGSNYGHPPNNQGMSGDYQRGTGYRNQSRPPPRGPYPDTRSIINYRDLDSPEDIDF